MTPSGTNPLAVAKAAAGRQPVAGAGGATWDELKKKVLSRLLERQDPAKTRHKPISILKQEARRNIEQLFDAEYPYVSKPDRQRIIDGVIADSFGFGPLEELLSDESVHEILILDAKHVIARRGDSWLPASVFFQDAEHLKAIIARMSEQGESLIQGADAKAAFDIKLLNGFRAVAIVPPAGMDHSPILVLTRGEAAPVKPSTGSSILATPGPRTSGSMTQSPRAGSNVINTPGPRSGVSIMSTPAPRSSPSLLGSLPNRSGVGLLSGSVTAGDTVVSSSSVVSSPTSRVGLESPLPGPSDPYAKMRGRITQRLITKLASAGVYDLKDIPRGEMQRIVTSMVDEANTAERLSLDATEQTRIALEILAGMQL